MRAEVKQKINKNSEIDDERMNWRWGRRESFITTFTLRMLHRFEVNFVYNYKLILVWNMNEIIQLLE